MDVSIIYVNYKTIDLIKDSIISVLKHSVGFSYEIIVVDNHTEDISMLCNIDTRIKTIQLLENIGFGKANNEGAKIATADYLFFLNPDTLLMNNAIGVLFDYIRSNSKVGVVGGNLFGIDDQPIHSYHVEYFTWTHVFRSLFRHKSIGNNYIEKEFNFSDHPISVGYITGADLLMPKVLFDNVEGFNKRMFMYFEDVDLCYKVKKQGLRCVNVPNAHIKHLEGQSLSYIPDNDERRMRRRKMNIESRKIFLRYTMNPINSFFMISCEFFINSIKYKIERLFGKHNHVLKLMIEQNKEYLQYILQS